MHIGSGTDLEHLAQVCGAHGEGGPQRRPRRSPRSAPAAACRSRIAKIKATSISTPTSNCGTPRASGSKTPSATSSRWKSSRAATWSAESGYLVTEIRAIKQMGGNTFYLLDAGFNNLARPILYGAYHPMSICPAQAARPMSDRCRTSSSAARCASRATSSRRTEGGFVCTRELPAAEIGDLLVIECAGAYGFVMGSNYNSKPLAAEVLIAAGKPHLIRARQTFDDLIRGETIPKL